MIHGIDVTEPYNVWQRGLYKSNISQMHTSIGKVVDQLQGFLSTLKCLGIFL